MMLAQAQPPQNSTAGTLEYQPQDDTIQIFARKIEQILQKWKCKRENMWLQERRRLASVSTEQLDEFDSVQRKMREEAADELRPYLPAFFETHEGRSPIELAALAKHLAPGGAHDDGLLVNIVRETVCCADELIIAAVIWHCWHGGKYGFQFLPDPALIEEDDYSQHGRDLAELLELATDSDPHRLLIGDDLAFFDSLPDSFSIYRGCAGISERAAALGLCWSIKREIAEWFANRTAHFCGADPVLMTARVRKRDVLLAKAVEFEIVVSPSKARRLQPRTSGRNPKDMEWQPPS